VRPKAIRLQLALVEFVRPVRSASAGSHAERTVVRRPAWFRLDDALEGSPGDRAQIREKFPAALIDEFQDTDPTQYGSSASVSGAKRGSDNFSRFRKVV